MWNGTNSSPSVCIDTTGMENVPLIRGESFTNAPQSPLSVPAGPARTVSSTQHPPGDGRHRSVTTPTSDRWGDPSHVTTRRLPRPKPALRTRDELDVHGSADRRGPGRPHVVGPRCLRSL